MAATGLLAQYLDVGDDPSKIEIANTKNIVFTAIRSGEKPGLMMESGFWVPIKMAGISWTRTELLCKNFRENPFIFAIGFFPTINGFSILFGKIKKIILRCTA